MVDWSALCRKSEFTGQDDRFKNAGMAPTRRGRLPRARAYSPMATNKRLVATALPVRWTAFDVPPRLRQWVLENSGAIGVDGLDGAGKTAFALGLQSYLTKQRDEVRLLHVDDFSNDDVQNEVYQAFAAGELTEAHLDRYYHFGVSDRALFDAIKRAKEQTRYVIVEGVFLFKRPLLQILDFKAFLDVEPSIAKARFARRRFDLGEERSLDVFDRIWLPAFEQYCTEENPRGAADLIVAGW